MDAECLNNVLEIENRALIESGFHGSPSNMTNLSFRVTLCL